MRLHPVEALMANGCEVTRILAGAVVIALLSVCIRVIVGVVGTAGCVGSVPGERGLLPGRVGFTLLTAGVGYLDVLELSLHLVTGSLLSVNSALEVVGLISVVLEGQLVLVVDVNLDVAVLSIMRDLHVTPLVFNI